MLLIMSLYSAGIRRSWAGRIPGFFIADFDGGSAGADGCAGSPSCLPAAGRAAMLQEANAPVERRATAPSIDNRTRRPPAANAR